MHDHMDEGVRATQDAKAGDFSLYGIFVRECRTVEYARLSKTPIDAAKVK